MPGVAVGNLDFAGGVQQTQANPWFRIEGQPVVVVGDRVASHGEPPHAGAPPMVEGTPGFRVGGAAVCRAGHRASCGHVTTGRPWFRIW